MSHPRYLGAALVALVLFTVGEARPPRADALDLGAGDSHHLVPDILDFGDVATGATYSRTFEFFNDGDVPIDVRPDLAACYLFAVSPPSARVEPHGSQVFNVTFRPELLGELSCELELGPELATLPLAVVVREPGEMVTLSTDHVDFHGLHIGEWEDATVRLTNLSAATLELTAIVPGFTPLRLVGPGDGYAVAIGPGATQDYVIRFEPNFVGEYIDSLVFLGLGLVVELTGNCIPDDLDVIVEPRLIDYGYVEHRTAHIETVDITNYQDSAVLIAPRMEPQSTSFIRVGDWAYRMLYPGETRTIWINYYPAEQGTHATTLILGDDLPTVPVLGSYGSRTLNIDPSQLDFGTQYVGSITQRSLVMLNPSTQDVDMEVFLEPDGSPFEVIGGDSLDIIPPGSVEIIYVRFQPTQEGDYSTALHLSPDEGYFHVQVIASARREIPVCSVSVTNLAFPQTPTGGGTTLDLTVTNTGTGTLHLSPYIDCTEFMILAAKTELDPGRSGSVTVIFVPQEIGDYECVLSLGNETCSQITLTGSAFVGPPAGFTNDRVGVYFDTGFSRPWIFDVEDRHRFEAYLVLKNPLGPDDVTGFECKILDTERLLLEDVVLQPGAYNFSVLPEFTVGLGVPQPSSDSILLATLSYMALGVPHNEPISLVPKRNPSIPNAMALISGPQHVLRPMYPASGLPEVAWVNYWDRSVGIEDPPDAEGVPEAVKKTRLLPNVPNPFNPETTIHFEVTRTGPVRIDVFNVMGRWVATLLNEERPAGPGQVAWRGQDARGRTVASGAYYVRLETAQRIDTRKVMLLK